MALRKLYEYVHANIAVMREWRNVVCAASRGRRLNEEVETVVWFGCVVSRGILKRLAGEEDGKRLAEIK